MPNSRVIVLLLFICSSWTSAGAQELKPGQTVMTRARPDYDPVGVPVRSFRLYPELAVSAAYDSNIFATRDNEVDDHGYIVAPTLLLQSDWTRHNLETGASLQSVYYSDYSEQDFTDYDIWAAGGLEVGSSSRFGARASHAQ